MESARSGTPAKDTGLPPGVAVGGLGRRVLAYVIDNALPAVVAGIVSSLLPGLSAGAAVAAVAGGVVVGLAWGIVCWFLLATRAATPGMRLAKLQLVGFLDGRPVGWGRVLVRAIVFWLVTATGLGFLLLLVFLLLHPRRQGWHDLAANGVVIAERPLAPPRPREPRVVEAPAPVPTPQPAYAAAASAPVAVASAPLATFDPVRPPVDDATVVQAAVSAPTMLDGWFAVLDDGREIALRGLVLVGRNPQPGVGEEDAQLIKLADESRTVSKSHLALGVDDAGLFAVDRGSTNGSTVTTPDGASTRCVPGEAVSVQEGSIVSIGDHWMRIRRDPS